MKEVGAVTIVDDPDPYEPDPDDWLELDPESLSPEAVTNDPDDVLTALPRETPLPDDADAAEVVDQRTEAGRTDGDDEDDLDEL